MGRATTTCCSHVAKRTDLLWGRFHSSMEKAKDRGCGSREGRKTYVELNLCEVSNAALPDVVSGGHREKLPLAVIQKSPFVILHVFSVPQEAQVYVFH